MPQNRAHRVLIGLDLLIRVEAARLNGLEEGQKPEAHLAERVRKRNRLHRAREFLGHIHARVSNQRGKIADALRGIVVAADDEHANARRCETGNKRVERRHSLALRRSLLIYVARDDHRVSMLGFRERRNLIQQENLIL